MKILVTGGLGFIGKHFVASLPDEIEIVIVDPNKTSFFESNKNIIHYSIGLQQTNILSKALENVDIVYHFANSTVPSTSQQNFFLDLQNNLQGTLMLLDTMLAKNIRRIVFLSSGGTVYGNAESFPTKETHCLKPINAYGATKVSIESYLSVYSQNYGIESIILRPSNIYGLGVGRTGTFGLVTTAIEYIKNNIPLHIFGDGKKIRDFLYIDDFAQLLHKTVFNFKAGIYNVGTDESFTLNKIISIVEETLEKKAIIEYNDNRVFDVDKVILNSSLVKETFNWFPTTTLKDGIKKIIQ